MKIFLKKFITTFSLLSVIVWSGGATAFAEQPTDTGDQLTSENTTLVSICHTTGEGTMEIEVASEAISGHLEHGDTVGQCPPPPPPPQNVTIKAHKIVCDSEEYAPNMSGRAVIDSSTAQSIVDNSQGHCDFMADWEFQWGKNDSLLALQGDYVGKHINDGWYDFSSVTGSDSSAPAEVTVNMSDVPSGNRLWFREVLEDGYIPFSFPSKEYPSAPGSDISAEFWCNQDVANYDNAEWIDVSSGNTYYCVGINVLKEPKPAPYAPWCSALMGVLKDYFNPISSVYLKYNDVADINNDQAINLSDTVFVTQMYNTGDDANCYKQFEDPEDQFHFTCENYTDIGWCQGLWQGIKDSLGAHTDDSNYSIYYDLNDDGVIDGLDVGLAAQIVIPNNQVACYAHFVPPMLQCSAPQEEVITVCKTDEQQNPLSGWEMSLYGNNLITNGDFEVPALSSGTWAIYPLDNLTSWTVESGDGLEIQNNADGAPHGGSQLGELDSNNSSVISQTITTTPGKNYNLKFWYSPRPNRPAGDNTIGVQVLSDDTTLVNQIIGDTAVGTSNTTWELYSYNFTATEATTKIKFSDLGTSNSYGGYLDDVEVKSVNSGITGENGCVEFIDLPYNTYEAWETMQTDWTQVAPGDLGHFVINFNEDNSNPTVTFVNRFDGNDDKPYCGDGHIDTSLGEECDGGESVACTIDGYAGTKSCHMPLPSSETIILQSTELRYCVFNPCVTQEFCGDGIKNGTEQCDAGRDGSDVCTPNCTTITPPNPQPGPSGGGGGGGFIPINIFNVQNSVATNSANITWETTRQSLTWILYGTTSSYGSEYQGTNYHATHTMALADLLPGTTYHYQIRAKDSGNSTAYDIDRTFTTPGLAPQVLGIKEIVCKPDVDGDIVGVMQFISGALIRGCGPEVYHVLGNDLFHIPNWQYLHDNYFAQRIYNVADEVIAQYGQTLIDDKTVKGKDAKILGVKFYADGTLLKASDGKIYVIINGKKVHIISLEDLKKYSGNKIYNVTDTVLNQY